MKKIILIIIAIIFILSIASNNNDNKEKEKYKNIPDGQVGIVYNKLNFSTIDVIIKNNTKKDLEYIKINAECYDENGNNLGTVSAGQYNINTKDNYKISIFCSPNTKNYKLTIEYK